MKSHKRLVQSAILKREAHADVFEVGQSPAFLFALFGGSGIDQEEYEVRSRSVIPLFESLLADVAHDVPDFVFVHITAPYDLPIRHFARDSAAAAQWNTHVLTELLQPWTEIPFYVCGFSSGAVLALSGLHMHVHCLGAAALGADAIPPNFVCPSHWQGKLRFYAAPRDVVCQAPENRRTAELLAARGQAERFGLRGGTHRLADYAVPECLGNLLIAAAHMAPDVHSKRHPNSQGN